MALVVNKQQDVKTVTADAIEIFLQSGELYFGSAPTVISTMLHSRTVITFWHPKTMIGGLCHIEQLQSPDHKCEMNYGDCAITEIASTEKNAGSAIETGMNSPPDHKIIPTLSRKLCMAAGSWLNPCEHGFLK